MNVASAYTPARVRTPTPAAMFNGVEPSGLHRTYLRESDSHYYSLDAGSLHQVPEGWWVYEACIAAEGWMIVH